MRVTVFLFSLIGLFSFSAHAVEYAIERVKDNVYRFTAGNYHSVFVTIEQGTIVTDPISPDAATYLRQYLSEKKLLPVSYMLYSHNHTDHVGGGEQLAGDKTVVIAHKQAAQDIAFNRLPTRQPDITFNDELTVTSGSTQVHLAYHGENNGKGSVSYLIQPAGVLHVVDWIVVGRLPYKDLPGYDIQGMISSTKAVLSRYDFEVFVGGHADIGTRADIEHYLAYLEALYSTVRDGMLAGKTLAELQQSITLEPFSDLKMYNEWLADNIKGVYQSLVDDSYFNFRADLDTTY
ncbi:MAG: MBL fold metallo-hydrolase [Pseudomonadota bacterium]|nr:MBL fold metallo-hydrolase [Pseudomonadota bacterium]